MKNVVIAGGQYVCCQGDTAGEVLAAAAVKRSPPAHPAANCHLS
jgi:hypothetical protein